MSLASNAKDIAKLVQTLGNMELYERINRLQADILELLEEKQRLQEENRKLRTELEENAKAEEIERRLVFRDNQYWLDDDGGFCSACWDNNHKLVRVLYHQGGYFTCPVCRLGRSD